MTGYALMLQPRFTERAAMLPKEAKAKLVRILWLLSQNVRHPSLQCKKVQGAKACLYECRVDQGIRLIYDVCQDRLRCWYVGEHDVALAYAKATSPQDSGVVVEDIVVVPRTDDLHAVLHFMASGDAEREFLETDYDEWCKNLLA